MDGKRPPIPPHGGYRKLRTFHAAQGRCRTRQTSLTGLTPPHRYRCTRNGGEYVDLSHQPSQLPARPAVAAA